MSEDTNVRVAVRCRPFNNRENGLGEKSCVKFSDGQLTLVNPANAADEHQFRFDLIFDQKSRQEEVWAAVGQPTLDKAFGGFNGTIFAYGQTGSGKTWSMTGADGENRGIIPRLCQSLFERIDKEKQQVPTLQFLVTSSYFEIYNEIIYDLLDPHNSHNTKKGKSEKKTGLEIKEHPALGVYVKGLQEIVVDNGEKLQNVIDQGIGSRTVASTQMNSDSSRSHSVLTITIHQKDSQNETKNIFAKMNLVDLAGSERVKSTGASGSVLKEGANINKSLMELGNVINALVEQSKGKKGVFIPYRNSKLTRVLQESLGGNSITTMVAALSPACINFEETMSTLKYANRAKAIKVCAVKNEEASKIDKLNDEIRLLKEKLAQNGSGGTAVADTSALEEKHKQQLRELEAVMKNSWEEKSRLSQQHEIDRKKQDAEAAEMKRKLAIQKERNWQLLEDKNDLELSISHLKDSLVGVAGSQVAGSSGESVSGIIAGWSKTLKEIMKHDQKLEEQSTIVEVYRASLYKDVCTVFNKVTGDEMSDTTPVKLKFAISMMSSPSLGDSNPVTGSDGKNGIVISCDKAALGMWRQLKAKIKSLGEEMSKWLQLQDTLYDAIKFLYSDINRGDVLWDEVMSEIRVSERTDLLRGFQLLLRQLKKKIMSNKQSVQETYNNIYKFCNVIVDDVQRLLTNLNGVVRDESAKEEEVMQKMTNGSEEHMQSFSLLLGKWRDLCTDIVDAVASIGNLNSDHQSIVQMASADTANSEINATQRAGGAPNSMNLSCIPHYFLESANTDSVCPSVGSSTVVASVVNVTRGSDNPGELVTDHVEKSITTTATVGSCSAHDASVNGNEHWYSNWAVANCKLSSSHETVVGKTGRVFAEIVLQNPCDIRTLTLQKGNIPVTVTVVDTTTVSRGAEAVDSVNSIVDSCKDYSMQIVPLSGATPPEPLTSSNLSLATCNGSDLDLTSAALGTVIDWVPLLKKNSPLKFLKRPPVRFLFDLFRFVYDTLLKVKGNDADLFLSKTVLSEWEVVAVDKPSKVAYMQEVINSISSYLSVPPAANATSIVTGNECDATNVLLQHLALASHHWIHVKKQDASSEVAPAALLPVVTTNTTTTAIQLSCCVTKFLLEVSSDGETYVPIHDNSEYCVEDLSSGSPIDIDLGNENGTNVAKYVRFYPLTWVNSHDCQDSKIESLLAAVSIPAMRISVKGYGINLDTDNTLGSIAQIPENHDSLQKVFANKVLSNLKNSFSVILDSLDYLNKLEENKKIRKSEEIRQHMEGLASEKLLLEQKLANDKQNMVNENQNLSDQLERALLQLKETEDLLSREQQVRAQVEKMLEVASSEKDDLISTLQTNSEENSTMKTEILKLQASVEKNNYLIDSLESKLGDAERVIAESNTKIEDMQRNQEILEHDKDDLINQISVLVEEKEATQSHEEELFEQLEAKTTDLELLQESYVVVSDRCNDGLDEICDLRDQVESLQRVIKDQKALIAHQSTSLESYAVGNNPAKSMDGSPNIVPSHSRSVDQLRPVSTVNHPDDSETADTFTSRSADHGTRSGMSLNAAADTDTYDDDFENENVYEDEFEDEDE